MYYTKLSNAPTCHLISREVLNVQMIETIQFVVFLCQCCFYTRYQHPTSPIGSGEMEQFISSGCYVFFNSSIFAVCTKPSFSHTKHIKIIINNVFFDKGCLVFSRLPLFMLRIYSFYWESRTSDLLELTLFVLQYTDYKYNFLTLTLNISKYTSLAQGITWIANP